MQCEMLIGFFVCDRKTQLRSTSASRLLSVCVLEGHVSSRFHALTGGCVFLIDRPDWLPAERCRGQDPADCGSVAETQLRVRIPLVKQKKRQTPWIGVREQGRRRRDGFNRIEPRLFLVDNCQFTSGPCNFSDAPLFRPLGRIRTPRTAVGAAPPRVCIRQQSLSPPCCVSIWTSESQSQSSFPRNSFSTMA